MGNITTVNKLGGDLMSRPDRVLNLARVLKARGENVVFVVSAFRGLTDALYDVLDKLHGKDYDEQSIRVGFQIPLNIIIAKIDGYFEDGVHRSAALDFVEREVAICVRSLMTHKNITTSLDVADSTYSIRDQIIAFGERSVIGVLEEYLKESDVDAFAVNDIEYGGTGERVSQTEVYRSVVKGIANSLLPYKEVIGKKVLIIGGHVRDVLRGMIPEISRSYTDFTAYAVGVALDKKLGVPIDGVNGWKNVKGVLSGDPTQLDIRYNTPVVHPDVSLAEMTELGGSGAMLMQIDALRLALQEGIPLGIRDYDNPLDDGTTFSAGEVKSEYPFKIIQVNERVDTLTCEIPSMVNRKGFFKAMSTILDTNGICINDVLTASTSICFTINLPKDKPEQDELRRRIRKAQSQLRRFHVDGEIYECQPRWNKGRANVVIIGDELLDDEALDIITGVLKAEGYTIEALMMSDPRRKISIYLNQRDALKAMQSLHRVLIDKDQAYAREVRGKIEARFQRFLGTDA